MRLGRYFGLGILFFFVGAGVGENEVPEHGFLMENFIESVILQAKDHFPEWKEELSRTFPKSGLYLRRHASPFDETQLDRKRESWLFFWRRAPKAVRPSSRHLAVIRNITEEVRAELCVRQSCGYNRYPWTEKNHFQFEKLVAARITSLALAFEERVEGFHKDRVPPSPYEKEVLIEQYLEIWTLGALMEIESAEFLSAFPIVGSHRERLAEQHELPSQEIGSCRIAIVRMADTCYRW